MRDTVRMFEHIRTEVGDDVALCHDVHERLKPVDAIRLACDLEPFDLFFLEDAIALEDGDWLRQLRAKTRIRWRRASSSTTRSNGARCSLSG